VELFPSDEEVRFWVKNKSALSHCTEKLSFADSNNIKALITTIN
jgi:hypothetical protein